MTEVPARPRANALITVHKYESAAYDEPAQGPALTRIHVDESFSGDITGNGAVEFLQAARADGSASFVGIERVSGTVGGREGTFLLQDTGTVDGNIVNGDWFVIAGSGTGELSGLRGEGGVPSQSRRERAGVPGLLVRISSARVEPPSAGRPPFWSTKDLAGALKIVKILASRCQRSTGLVGADVAPENSPATLRPWS